MIQTGLKYFRTFNFGSHGDIQSRNPAAWQDVEFITLNRLICRDYYAWFCAKFFKLLRQ